MISIVYLFQLLVADGAVAAALATGLGFMRARDLLALFLGVHLREKSQGALFELECKVHCEGAAGLRLAYVVKHSIWGSNTVYFFNQQAVRGKLINMGIIGGVRWAARLDFYRDYA
jgi:hypothetical protein